MVRIYLENMVPSDVSNAVRKTLADLHERGYKIALGSSSRKAKIILKKVALLNWNPSFQFASLSSDLANRLHK